LHIDAVREPVGPARSPVAVVGWARSWSARLQDPHTAPDGRRLQLSGAARQPQSTCPSTVRSHPAAWARTPADPRFSRTGVGRADPRDPRERDALGVAYNEGTRVAAVRRAGPAAHGRATSTRQRLDQRARTSRVSVFLLLLSDARGVDDRGYPEMLLASTCCVS
jgi:hypothetical protein